MAESTGISWADATFNPWIGCEKVSPGCAHCYAETLVTGRMARPGTWGVDGVRQVTSPSNWKKPLRWARLAEQGLLPDGSENPDGHRPRISLADLAAGKLGTVLVEFLDTGERVTCSRRALRRETA